MRIEVSSIRGTSVLKKAHQYKNMWEFDICKENDRTKIRIEEVHTSEGDMVQLFYDQEIIKMFPWITYQIWGAFFKLHLDDQDEI